MTVQWKTQLFSLKVDPDETILVLKQQLMELTKLPIEKIKIYYTGPNREFDDDKTLRHYGLQGGGFFHMDKREEGEVPPSSTTTTTMKSSALKHSTSEQQFPKNTARLSLTKKNQQIQLRRSKSSEHAHTHTKLRALQQSYETEEHQEQLDAQRADSNAREQIAAKKKTRKKKPTTQESTAGRVHQAQEMNSPVIASVESRSGNLVSPTRENVEEKKSLPQQQQQQQSKQRITVVLPDGNRLSLDVNRNATIYDIQTAIAEHPGCPLPLRSIPKQVLRSNIKSNVTDAMTATKLHEHPHRTLTEAKIHNNDQLVLELLPELPSTITVHVNTPDGSSVPIVLDLAKDTIGDIKQKLESKTNIPISNQFISPSSSSNADFDDDTKMVASCNIRDGDVLNLHRRTRTVYIQTPTGKSLQIQCNATDSILDIKNKIAAQVNMDPSQQIMTFQKKEMSNASTVEDRGIQDGSTVVLSSRKMPVTVYYNSIHSNKAATRNSSSSSSSGSRIPGDSFEILVNPTDSIYSIKQQLESKTGIPVSNQQVSLLDKVLSNNTSTVQDNHMKPGSILHLQPKTIHVSIMMPSGNNAILEVKPLDTIRNIKEHLACKHGIDAAKQILSFLHGKELSCNDQTLQNEGIVDGSKLQMTTVKIPITVKTHKNQRIELLVDPTDPIGRIKEQLHHKTDIPIESQCLSLAGQELSSDIISVDEYGIQAGDVLDLSPQSMVISVKMASSDAVVSLQVKPSDSAKTIKQQIQKAFGLDIHQQILSYQGKEVSNFKTMQNIGVTDGSEFLVSTAKVPIQVNTSNGQQVKLMIDPTDSIESIKQQLEEKTGVPVNNQDLFFRGKKLHNDQKSAMDCGIQAGSVLDMMPKLIRVNVRTPADNVVVLQVKPDDLISTIKNELENKIGLAAVQQRLSFNSNNDLDNASTIKKLGIVDGSELMLKSAPFSITVRAPTGKKLQVMVNPQTDTVGTIKKQLEQESGIPAANQNLSLLGNVLSNDGATTEKCDIKPGSELDLSPKCFNIVVRTASGTNAITLQIKPSSGTTGKDIKNEVAKKIDGKETIQHQILKFQGKEIPNFKSVEDFGITDGSQLVLEDPNMDTTVNSDTSDNTGKTGLNNSSNKVKNNSNTNKLEDLKRRQKQVKSNASAVKALSDCHKSQHRNGLQRPNHGGVSRDESTRNNKTTTKQPPADLSLEKKRKCYMWYARLGQPTRDQMIRAVEKLTSNREEITVEDVKALPWIAGGTMLPVKEMNDLIMNG